MPERLDLLLFQPRFVVHPELNRVDLREHLDEPPQRRLRVRHEVLFRDSVDESGDALPGVLRGPWDPAALHASAIDVTPNPRRDLDASLVRQADHRPERRRIALLLRLRDP